MANLVYLVAGGTGGHINAALSIAEVLDNSYSVKFISGTRHLDYKLFAKKPTLHLDSKPLRSASFFQTILYTLKNLTVFFTFFFRLLVKRPQFIVGAGGYICGPTLLAAYFLAIPVFIVEQNAVMGVTNKILSKIAKKIFVNFKETKGLEKNKKVVVSGNPIRSNIQFTKQVLSEEHVNVLIFGGSLGASQINDAVVELVKIAPTKKINIRHQVGKENTFELPFMCQEYDYQQYEYFDNMNEQYQWANIIISRAGASSVSELMRVAKPVVLIPYPAATDNHQFYNALNLKKEVNFCVEVIDHTLSGHDLAKVIKSHLEVLLADDNKLKCKPSGEFKPANLVIKEEIEKCLV